MPNRERTLLAHFKLNEFLGGDYQKFVSFRAHFQPQPDFAILDSLSFRTKMTESTWRFIGASLDGVASSNNIQARCPKHNFPTDIPPPPPTLVKGIVFKYSMVIISI